MVHPIYYKCVTWSDNISVGCDRNIEEKVLFVKSLLIYFFLCNCSDYQFYVPIYKASDKSIIILAKSGNKIEDSIKKKNIYFNLKPITLKKIMECLKFV